MSADNGIYILRTKKDTVTLDGWVERVEPYPVWRVAHVGAIDNFYYYQEEQPYNLGAYMQEVWGKSPVFVSKEDALAFAEEVEKHIDFVEYGISFIETDLVFYGDD